MALKIARGNDKKNYYLFIGKPALVSLVNEKKKSRRFLETPERKVARLWFVDCVKRWETSLWDGYAEGVHDHAVENWKCELAEEVSLTAEGVAMLANF